MANEENLIPTSKRTKSEAREMASRGGIASGKARRKKANLKKAFENFPLGILSIGKMSMNIPV